MVWARFEAAWSAAVVREWDSKANKMKIRWLGTEAPQDSLMSLRDLEVFVSMKQIKYLQKQTDKKKIQAHLKSEYYSRSVEAAEEHVARENLKTEETFVHTPSLCAGDYISYYPATSHRSAETLRQNVRILRVRSKEEIQSLGRPFELELNDPLTMNDQILVAGPEHKKTETFRFLSDFRFVEGKVEGASEAQRMKEMSNALRDRMVEKFPQYKDLVDSAPPSPDDEDIEDNVTLPVRTPRHATPSTLATPSSVSSASVSSFSTSPFLTPTLPAPESSPSCPTSYTQVLDNYWSQLTLDNSRREEELAKLQRAHDQDLMDLVGKAEESVAQKLQSLAAMLERHAAGRAELKAASEAKATALRIKTKNDILDLEFTKGMT